MRQAKWMLWLSCTFERWYSDPGSLGKGRTSRRPLCSISMKPSSMSMFGVPYSPIVPSLIRWAFGTWSRIAQSSFSEPMTLLCWVMTAFSTLFIDQGAEGCSP